MKFDAGRWGIVDVDKIETMGDATIGVVNPHDLHKKTTYINRGRLGCSKVSSRLDPNSSIEDAEKNRQNTLNICYEIIDNLRE